MLDVLRLLNGALRAIWKHVDLFVIQEIIGDQGPVRQRQYRIAELVCLETEFGGAVPVGPNFQQRLSPVEIGGLWPDLRVVEYRFRPAKVLQPGIEQRHPFDDSPLGDDGKLLFRLVQRCVCF